MDSKVAITDELKIEWWDIERVKDYATNPRTITKAAVEKVAASIKKFGWRQPIVVDEQGVIIVGHTRKLGALHLGMKKVPVHVAVGMSPEDAAAYRLADNRTGEETDWDQVLLAKEVAALRLANYDISALAFDDIELRSAAAGAAGHGVQGDPTAEWTGMPEYVRGTDGMHKQVILHFPDQAAVDAFSELIGQKIGPTTKYLWYPKQPLTNPSERVFVTEPNDQPNDNASG